MRSLVVGFLALSLFLLSGPVSKAQSKEPVFVQGELLVRLMEDRTPQALQADLGRIDGMSTQLKATTQLSRYMNIWLLKFDENIISEKRMLQEVWLHSDVQTVQYNHLLSPRIVPNDPNFSSQWQYVNNGGNGGVVDADIDADSAWNITTGGLTPMGDTIVVCIIDDGIDLNHPDFGNNIWVNHNEIPNNNIDDDGNGYVDDYQGWDADNGGDNITGGGHGTPVAGIVGAKGNNGIGVTGVNWDVKLMIVQGGGNEAQAIAAYSYALENRRLYNQTNGQKGAFVVSTNASWGIDYGQPSQAPLWCAMYDTLGAYGILSAGATINGNENVDQVGDLPTACPSDFLIAVTNTRRNDNKETQAGYGSVTIDLGAPGSGTYTPQRGGGYGGFGGTSGATPHVAGTIAMLYSAPCSSFAVLSKQNPKVAAALAKQYILDGIDPNASLSGITVTGGRLNLHKALLEAINDCSSNSCYKAFFPDVTSRTDTSATLAWTALNSGGSYIIEYRAFGVTPWSQTTATTTPYVIQGLNACTDYEIRIRSVCGNDSSNYTTPIQIKTEGCCEPPSRLDVSNVQSATADLSWPMVFAANSYTIRYREVGGSNWITVSGITGTSDSLTGLTACTEYEAEIQTVCDSGATPYTSVLFRTKGCGDCQDLAYCESYSNNSSDEWIARVVLNTLDNVSGNDGGYADYTGMSTTLDLGGSYTLQVTPGYSGQTYSEHFIVWIDFDHDGLFSNAERVFNQGNINSQTQGTVVIPATATQGITRMRVAMRFQNAVPNACEVNYDYGEVEDYCVDLQLVSKISSPSSAFNLEIAPNPAQDRVQLQIDSDQTRELEFFLRDLPGRQIMNKKITLNGSYNLEISLGHLPSGVYLVELRDSKGEQLNAKIIKP